MSTSTEDRLRQVVERLCEIKRPSASAGERASAEWIQAELERRGLVARIEEERGTGGYWVPLGLLSAAGLVGAGLVASGRRWKGAALAAAATVGLADDLALGRRWFRHMVARRRTWNVVGEVPGDSGGHTVVFVAHHDAAHSGFIFDPSGGERLAERAPWLIGRINTDPPVFWPVVGGPALIATGAALRRPAMSWSGAGLAIASLAAFGDIALRHVVPGAIDNASGVAALIELADRIRESPPTRVRVLFVFTGSEEALWEGMEAFGARHFHSLPPERTFFLSVDQVGDRRLCVLRGEGPLSMRHYRDDVGRLVHEVAAELGIEMPFTRLRSRTGTDAQYPAKAGYPTASLQSKTEDKLQTAYHWPTDTPDVVDYRTVADAVRLCEGVVRRLDERWLEPTA